MKANTFLVSLAMLFFSACTAQDNARAESIDDIEKDSLSIDPNAEIHVNREYDEHGNLIAYDSTYTRIYSGDGMGFVDMDSLMNSFGIQERMPFFSDPFFQGLDGFAELDSTINQRFGVFPSFRDSWQPFDMDKIMDDMRARQELLRQQIEERSNPVY